MKRLCKDQHIQVICTTHSPAILQAIPLEGHFYIEGYQDSTKIIPCISPEYTDGKLSGDKSGELTIYVENGVARIIVEAVFDIENRKHVSIVPISSSVAVIRQMAARYKEQDSREYTAILDGDQFESFTKHEKYFISVLEGNVDSGDAISW